MLPLCNVFVDYVCWLNGTLHSSQFEIHKPLGDSLVFINVFTFVLLGSLVN